MRWIVAAALAVGLGTGWASAQGLGGGEDPQEVLEQLDLESPVRDVLAGLIAEAGPTAEDAVTTADPTIDLRALGFALLPMTAGDLDVEALGWQALLEEAAAELAEAEYAIVQVGDAEAAAVEEAGGDEAAVPPELEEQRQALLEEAAELRDARAGVLERFRRVLDELESKGGDMGAIEGYRTYAGAVSGVEVDVSDPETALTTIRTWLLADQGGKRVAGQILGFLGIVALWYFIGWVLSLLVNLGLKQTGASSVLLRRFLRVWIRRIALVVGALMALSAVGVNITPLVAAVGAAGFILAFALQNSLSNLASGLLIMLQRPFDVGDEVEAAEISGTVEEVSLFSTYLSTEENKKVIVPNNMIWDGIIVNATGAETRRLAIEVEVSAEDHDLAEAETKLMQVMRDNTDVLDEPAPEVKLKNLSKESMTFVCWPWVETAKKDSARWALVSEFGRALSLESGAVKAGEAEEE